MSDHLEERDTFEERLRTLHPKPVSRRLQDELRSAVEGKTGRRVFPVSRKVLVGLAWAAGLLVLVGGVGYGVLGVKSGSRGIVAGAKGVSAWEVKDTTDWVLGCRQIAIWHSPDGVPYRVLQWLTIQQKTLKDPVSGKEMTKAEPKQRVVLLAMESN